MVRGMLSAAFVILLLAVAAVHLPSSALARATGDPSGQLLRGAGLEQQWSVFAPDPRRISLELRAEVVYADGTRERWAPPQGSALTGSVRFYRWRKWIEAVRLDSSAELWAPTARWIASEHTEHGDVVEVSLIRRFRDNVLEGEQPEWREFTFYTLPLDEDAGS